MNIEGGGFAAALAPEAAEVCNLGSVIWMVFFAAVKGYVG